MKTPLDWLAHATKHRLKPRKCPGCKEWVLYTALLDVLDPTPLTPQGEALAIINGQPTWHVTQYLDPRPRTTLDITEHPAGLDSRSLPTDVYPTHRCRTKPYPHGPSRLAAATSAPDPVNPPY